jgi:hypothetical protein
MMSKTYCGNCGMDISGIGCEDYSEPHSPQECADNMRTRAERAESELAKVLELLDGCDFEVVYDIQVGWVLQGEGRVIIPSPRMYIPLPSAPKEEE